MPKIKQERCGPGCAEGPCFFLLNCRGVISPVLRREHGMVPFYNEQDLTSESNTVALSGGGNPLHQIPLSCDWQVFFTWTIDSEPEEQHTTCTKFTVHTVLQSNPLCGNRTRLYIFFLFFFLFGITLTVFYMFVNLFYHFLFSPTYFLFFIFLYCTE